MACRHIVEHCLALAAEPVCNTLFAVKSPVSATILSALVPEFCVQPALTRRQQKEHKLAQMVSTDCVGAPLSITGTYCDHWAANNVDDVYAALATQIDVLYRLDYKGDLSDKDSLSKEVSKDWLKNPDPNLCRGCLVWKLFKPLTEALC
jgi:hypothetical protein